MNTEKTFPTLPGLRAEWAPVYMEPIINSGERITVGIAAVSETGETLVVPTIGSHQLTCAFGKEGSALLNSATLCLNSLKKYLDSRDGTWLSPLSGIEMGPWTPAAGDDLTNIVRNAMRLASSFSALAKTDILLDKTVGPSEAFSTEGTKARVRETYWASLIRQEIHKRQPAISQNLGREFQIVRTEQARATRFDYLGVRYAANFSQLTPDKLSQRINYSKAKLWDLESLRDMQTTLEISQYELIAWMPSEGTPDYTDKQMQNVKDGIEELTGEADSRGLGTAFVNNAVEASQRIIEHEIALS